MRLSSPSKNHVMPVAFFPLRMSGVFGVTEERAQRRILGNKHCADARLRGRFDVGDRDTLPDKVIIASGETGCTLEKGIEESRVSFTGRRTNKHRNSKTDDMPLIEAAPSRR